MHLEPELIGALYFKSSKMIFLIIIFEKYVLM
jgi:hypothetical protein